MNSSTPKTEGPPPTQLRKIFSRSPLVLIFTAPLAGLLCGSGLQAQPLWQIGRADQSAAEFALAQNGYPQFLQRFGSPDRAFYVGLSEPASDWALRVARAARCIAPRNHIRRAARARVAYGDSFRHRRAPLPLN